MATQRRIWSTACLPEAPDLQWVLSPPFALCCVLAYDARLLRAILRCSCARCLDRRRARRVRQLTGRARCGAVSFVQRFGGAVNLYRHLGRPLGTPVYTLDGSAALFSELNFHGQLSRPLTRSGGTPDHVIMSPLRIARRERSKS
jgi:hypothetical protein